MANFFVRPLKSFAFFVHISPGTTEVINLINGDTSSFFNPCNTYKILPWASLTRSGHHLFFKLSRLLAAFRSLEKTFPLLTTATLRRLPRMEMKENRTKNLLKFYELCSFAVHLTLILLRDSLHLQNLSLHSHTSIQKRPKRRPALSRQGYLYSNSNS
jgi:hypothetical protein